jgi:hypothetical protein
MRIWSIPTKISQRTNIIRKGAGHRQRQRHRQGILEKSRHRQGILEKSRHRQGILEKSRQRHGITGT